MKLEQALKEYEDPEAKEVFSQMVTADGDTRHFRIYEVEGRYDLQTFFTLGKKWVVSIDCANVDLKTLLLGIFKRFGDVI